jgi:hypothetical protein
MKSPGPSRPMSGRPATCLHVEGRLPIGREARRASASAASRAWAEWGGALTRIARSASSAPLLALRIYLFSRSYRTHELNPIPGPDKKQSRWVDTVPLMRSAYTWAFLFSDTP